MNMIKVHGLIVGSMTTIGLITYAFTADPATSMLAACVAGVVSTFVIIYLGLKGWL